MKPILEVHSVSKKFNIHHEVGYLSLRERITDLVTFSSSKKSNEEFWALRDIGFSVMPGESIGIIGKNGAGKSTLLKILSKITPPTEGRIISRGRIASLLEVGTGFHPELTGRENVYLNGSILGMRKKEIDLHFDEIIDFAGTGNFLDTPLKHYSSGMQLRLAFAVAAFLEPEILVIDEVLAVGDAEFQKKCIRKMEDVSNSGRTILFVSHDLNAISKLCPRTLLLNKGQNIFNGDTIEAIKTYQMKNREGSSLTFHGEKKDKPVYLKRIQVCNTDGNEAYEFLYTDPIFINFEIDIIDTKVNCDLFVIILNAQKRRVFSLESSKVEERMKLILEPEVLVRGGYSIYAFLNQPHIARLDEAEDVCPFEVIDNGSNMLKHGGYDYGDVFGRGKWVFD